MTKIIITNAFCQDNASQSDKQTLAVQTLIALLIF